MMCTVAAATSYNSPFEQRERFHSKLSHQHRAFAGSRFSDHVALLAVNREYLTQCEYGPQAEAGFCMKNSLSHTVLAMTT